ncbi:MAG TPA: chaplin family protein [Streptosporangiaceae bacterium]|jgi:hypothetical protein|nr:chaplin family protein [Streptosporangiaceae bacterium]
MRTKIIGSARAAMLTAGFVALGAGAALPAGAYADTSGTQSVLGGNQVSVPVNAPINACGNSIALVGTAGSSCEGGATAQGGSGAGSGRTSGTHSVGGGNQVTAPIKAPVNVCGNAVAVLGSSAAGCEGKAKARSGGSGSGGAGRTSGQSSVLGGNQAKVPVSAPVTVCGNSAAAFGDAVAGCEGGAKATGGGGAGGGAGRTSGRNSVLGGNQAKVPANVPVNVCGNAVGNAAASCEGGAKAGSGGSSGPGRTSGRSSVGGGNQAHVPANVPVNVCGNAAGVVGDAVAGCKGGSGGGNGGGHEDGDGGYGHGGDGYGSYGSHTPLTGVGAGDAATPKLPAVPGGTAVQPVSPAGAMPVLPELPAEQSVGSSPRTDTTTAAAPASSHLSEPGTGLPGEVRHGLKDPSVGAEPANLPIGQDEPHTMRPAAAGTPLSSGMTDDSLYILALGALLAGASAVIGITRRVRFTRR